MSSADSPFTGLPFSYFYLENFEDGFLNTPGVSANSGAIVGIPNNATDSVDGDDGVIDGVGNLGHSLYSGNGLTHFTFLFACATLGGLPTHAGIVWTDVGLVTSGNTYSGPVTAEAYDLANQWIGSLGPVTGLIKT